MTLPLRMDTTPVLANFQRENNPIAEWTISAGTGDINFRCVYVQMLGSYDSGDNHHVYVQVIGEHGERLSPQDLNARGFSIGYETTGLYQFQKFEKAAPEPDNFPLYAGNNASCMIVAPSGYSSDIVRNLSMPTREHKAYLVVLQLQKKAQKSEPPVVVTPPHQPGTVAVPMDAILEVERLLKELTAAVDRLR